MTSVLKRSYGNQTLNLGEQRYARLHTYANVAAMNADLANCQGRIVYCAQTDRVYVGKAGAWVGLPVSSIAANFPQWTKATFAFGALAAAATSNDIEAFSLPAGAIIHAARIKHSVSFAGGGITGYTLSLGITGTLAKYATAFDVHQAVGSTAYEDSFITGSEDFVSAKSIRLAAVSAGATLDQATAGSVDVWLLTSLAT